MPEAKWNSAVIHHDARNISPVRAPSTTMGAVILLCRKPATKVIVSQAPSGTVPITLTPRGARPLSRIRFVLTAVSSINTSRAGSSAFESFARNSERRADFNDRSFHLFCANNRSNWRSAIACRRYPGSLIFPKNGGLVSYDATINLLDQFPHAADYVDSHPQGDKAR